MDTNNNMNGMGENNNQPVYTQSQFNQPKKSNGGTTAIIAILVVLVLVLGGYIVYKEFIATDDTNNSNTNTETNTNINTNTGTDDTTSTDTNITTDNTKCNVATFSKNYTLTDADKTQIAKAVKEMIDSDVTVTGINSIYDNYLIVNIKPSKSVDVSLAVVYKQNGVFKCYTYGSGFDSDDIKSMSTNISTCTPAPDGTAPQTDIGTKCTLTTFSKNYTLTESEKVEIANLVNSDESMSLCQVVTSSLQVSSVYDNYIGVTAKTICNGSEHDPISMSVYKVDGVFKLGILGGHTNVEQEEFEQKLANMCK